MRETPHATRLDSVSPHPVRMTAAELLTYHDPLDRRTELVRGRLLVSEPPGCEHADMVFRLVMALGRWMDARTAMGHPSPGWFGAGDPGCWIEREPDTVRAPDIAFVTADRMPPVPARGFLEQPPTLAIEVLSPSDRRGQVAAKVAQWLAAGTCLVWVLDPSRRVAHVHRADGSTTSLTADAALDGEDVLPGFVLPLSQLFR
jgi:Uma2 family endonuclease